MTRACSGRGRASASMGTGEMGELRSRSFPSRSTEQTSSLMLGLQSPLSIERSAARARAVSWGVESGERSVRA
jgi:hypothetical protein